MKFKDIPLKDLVVNKDNDRHGHTPSEETAISWLFQNHGSKMIKLAEDIAGQQRIFDPPLVKPVGKQYVVFDGNRRVTSLKLLVNPLLAPENLQAHFSKLNAAGNFSDETLVSCQIETDQQEIDHALSRRHNGTDGGIGQLGWDPRAKANHAKRTGGTNQYPIAEAIENFLDEHGYPDANKIGRSTLFRLMNAKKRQRQFGIFLSEDGTLGLSRPKEDVLHLLTKVANDIVEKRLTLSNLLRVENVEKYLRTLEPYGLTDATTTSQTEKSNRSNNKPVPRRKRDTLIPDFVSYEISWRPNQGKIERLWQELQFSLRFSRHELAIPIAFRTLLELATHRYLERAKLPDKKSLSKNIIQIASSLRAAGKLTAKEEQDINRVTNDSRSPRDLEALHRVVHSNHFSVSKTDLISLWEGYEKYLLKVIDYK